MILADNHENKVLNVPQMRFPEFSGEWNKYTINDLATVVGGGTPDTTVKSYWGGDIQWFTPSEIGKNKYVDFSKRTITRDGLDNSSAKLLPLHTILLSSRATVGECSIASNECTTNQGFQSLIAKQCNIDFLYYLIQTKKKDLIRNACGSTFLEISANEIRKIKVAVPVQNEQEQIAKLLSLIDERIATQNKIIEDLKLLKSAIVDKLMTPQKEWKSTKIGNVLSIGSGRDYKHLEDGNIPVYGTGGYMLSVDSYLYDGESVCIGRKGTINKPIFLKGKFWTVDTLFYTHTFRSITPRFCYYLFTTIDWLKYNEASGVPSLSKVTIENISISIPDLVTQKQLCAVLDSMTDKLDIEQKLLDAYHAQKQYLLQQMFI